jgi:hypothetical protein
MGDVFEEAIYQPYLQPNPDREQGAGADNAQRLTVVLRVHIAQSLRYSRLRITRGPGYAILWAAIADQKSTSMLSFSV